MPRNFLFPWFGGLRNLVLPPVCLFCRRQPAAEGAGVCRGCGAELAWIGIPRCPGCGGPLDTALALCGECLQAGGPRPWRQAVSVFRFHGLARQGIHRFKYRDCPEFAPWFGRLMAEAWGQHGAGMPDVVAPVPLHWLREWRRGYNQAELLARAVAAGLGCPHQKLLRRQHSTKQQAKLHFLERQKNMEGVFRLKPGAEVLRKRVLLVDDVMTTGATLAAAAGPLLAAGAREIGILTAARG